MIEYYIDSLTINVQGQAIESDCVTITFLNYGTAALIVNDAITIPPPAAAGQVNQITFSGNVGEIDRTYYRCRFAAAGTKVATVVRRKYKSA